MIGKLLDTTTRARDRASRGLDLSSVRFHLSAGEALPPALLDALCIERFGGDVYDGIGSAEMFHIYCTNRPGDIKPGSLGKRGRGLRAPHPARGRARPGRDAGARRRDRRPVGQGRLASRSATSQDRDKSWKTFHGHWCRTGDLFRVDEHGYLWFEGRADDLLKVGGIWVAPVEVEECLMQHPAVSLAAVIGVEEGEGLVKPKAFVVVRARRAPDRRWQATRVARGRAQGVREGQA